MLEVFNQQLTAAESLSPEDMTTAMECIMSGDVPEAELVTFLTALRDKGETVDELTAAARVMREYSVLCGDVPSDLVDTCGTGGDGKGSFNISTAAAFVVAGAGVPVAKHGNRSVSSKSGSADVLEALGVKIDLDPEHVRACIQEAGIGFLFARRFHPAMKQVAQARQAIGTRTIFNLLGPLTNPARATRQLIGVFSRKWCMPLANVAAALGAKHVMVVHGADGMDEVTLTGKTYFVTATGDGQILSSLFDPETLGLSLCQPADLVGGDAEHNAHLLRGLLEGYDSPLRTVVLLNAAAALMVADRAIDWADGLSIAAKSVDQGRALQALKRLVEVSWQ